jgi:hypothetical protein
MPIGRQVERHLFLETEFFKTKKYDVLLLEGLTDTPMELLNMKLLHYGKFLDENSTIEGNLIILRVLE